VGAWLGIGIVRTILGRLSEWMRLSVRWTAIFLKSSGEDGVYPGAAFWNSPNNSYVLLTDDSDNDDS
jgi:hypothetical protein